MAHSLSALTRNSIGVRCVALAFALVVAASTATAQPAAGSTDRGLGIGVLSKQDAYRGIRREAKAVPLLRFENEYVEFSGLGLEVKLPGLQLGEGSRLKFGLVGEAELSGYEAKDAPVLAGMAERKGTLWVGAKATWENRFVDLSAEWAADASGHSKGRRFSPGVAKEWHGREHPARPLRGCELAGQELRGLLLRCRSRRGHRGTHGLRRPRRGQRRHRSARRPSLRAAPFAAARCRRDTPGRQIKASPIVGRSSTNQVIVGYMYSF
ncbi:MipA/OmpV family protein [Ramlibacter terrae]|uniref:MipA/OmpV family protein n=1 Tax=Ramlibacter terrae TaxID=2732511 RepID=A0ABX6P4N0_9BURK|nr:MipA/OmpV family protein [Ramlibacter terrae]